ncbi:MAG: LysR family transcriptional regulator [Ramlibacter sp.]|nr:LysR family transcriptional regulator [Ramlibacter sp.]MBX3660333.1 LysR family transcriptional regulator [Ramlibacter sp.]MCW5651800.1 LysR family transcriptional regulator [Ramlibacter sp.]
MNQLTLDDFALFVRVAALQSLSAAARERNVAASQVSRALARIEAGAGARLAHRTTHGLSLTDEGELFLEHAQRILMEHHQLQDQLGGRRGTVSGTVHIGVSQLLAQYVLIPHLASLRQKHPQLHVNLHVDDRLVGMADEGLDIAVRAGIPPPDTVIARPLGSHGRALYAAPAYLRRHGTPRTPHDLQDHMLIGNTASPSHNRWTFDIDGEPLTLTVAAPLRVNSSAAVVSLALAGAGIARINDVLGRQLVEQGLLKPVLARHGVPGEHPIYAAILAERHRATRIRATMDYLEACFAAFRKPRAAASA